MKGHTHPGQVNTSHLIFFLLTSAILSRGLVLPFYLYGEFIAWTLVWIWSVTLYFIWHWIRQFANEDHLIAYFLIANFAFPVIAGLVLNTLFGPLQAGTVPVLHGVGVVGWQTILVEAQPSVLLNYGVIAFAFGLWLAESPEWIYDNIVRRMLPASFQRKLSAVDRSVDRVSAHTTHKYFYSTDRGLLIGLLTLIIYTAVSIWILSLT